MLLKGVSDKFFFYKEASKNKFLGYEFYLEILLNDRRYLTIKRGVESHTKISFKLNNLKSDGYILYEQLDKNIPFDKAKSYLNDMLDFDFCKETPYDFRKIVNYNLRLQGDYEPKNNTIFQLSKFTNKNDKDSWHALIFSLLGFDGNLLLQKYEIENDIKKESQSIKAQEKNFGIKSEDKDSLIGKIQNAEIEKETLSKVLKYLGVYLFNNKVSVPLFTLTVESTTIVSSVFPPKLTIIGYKFALTSSV
jgi:hypothetical protein